MSVPKQARTRREINAQLRDHLGLHGAVPQPSDRLVCLRNNHRRGLLNGSTSDGRLTMQTNEAGEVCGGADAMIRAAYMQTAAIDFGASVITHALEGIGSAVEGVSILLDNLNKGA